MLNALTFDIEDWRQLIYHKITGEIISPKPEIKDETKGLLDLLHIHNVKATFFVLANVAETFPQLIRLIDNEGHEIASHGLSHRRVYSQSPTEFRNETRRAKQLLEEIIGKPIYGYRAAEFSITKQSLWALEILAEEGFAYDSSIFPIAGMRYGLPDFPLAPHKIRTNNSNILEFPLTAITRWRRRWPVCGGGYFRLLPYWVTRSAIKEVNRQRRPAVVYLHPYDLARGKLRVPRTRLSLKTCSVFLRYATIHNLARDALRERLKKLMHDFSFAPIKELLNDVTREQRLF